MTKTSVSKSPVVKTSLSKSSMPRSPTPRSPMPRSPMPKSPMPNSPMPKSPVIYEKYKSRCAYGLISFFNFRRRHSKKLIADTTDRRRLSRYGLGDGYTKNSLDLDSDLCIDDTRNVKEVSVEQQTKKKITTNKVENIQSKSELVHRGSRNQRKTTKTARRARRLPIYGCYDVSTMGNKNLTEEILADRSSKSLDSAVTAELLPKQVCPKNGGESNCGSTDSMQYNQHNEINIQVNMSEATEELINQKLIDGRRLCGDRTSHQSKHFLDALDILNSNKDLFIKLLQDPNSLLVKHIEDLRDCRANQQQTKPFTKECEIGNARECSLSKSKETGDLQLLENIVVLRPNRNSQDSPQIHYSLRNVQQSVRPTFFPFDRMKRKLMQTMRINRKEKQLLLTDGAAHRRTIHDEDSFKGCSKRTDVEIFTRNSTSSIAIKRKDQIAEVSEFDPGIREEIASASESCRENSFLPMSRNQERKKHEAVAEPSIDISELKNGNANFLRKQRAKTWDGISSVPECDFFPLVSSTSRGTSDHCSVSPQMRFCVYSNNRIGSDNNWRNQKEKKRSCLSPPRQNLEVPPWAVNKKQLQMQGKISDNLFSNVQEQKSISSTSRIETKCDENFERICPSKLPSKPDGSDSDGVISQSIETVESCEENGYLELSRLGSLVENELSTSSVDDCSSSPSNSRSYGDFYGIKDNAEQPSPVSVLDQFFTEESHSPPDTECQPVRRQQICIEEGFLEGIQPAKINSSSSTEEYGSIFKNISTALQECPLNWDELALKCHFSDQLLDGSLFDGVESCGGDRKLLIDYVNESLVDICWHYLRCSPWLSSMEPRRISTKITGSILHEVIRNVDCNLVSATPLQTLEKIIEKDLLHRSRTWMDIRMDVEDVVCDMVDSLVEEFIVEIVTE